MLVPGTVRFILRRPDTTGSETTCLPLVGTHFTALVCWGLEHSCFVLTSSLWGVFSALWRGARATWVVVRMHVWLLFVQRPGFGAVYWALLFPHVSGSLHGEQSCTDLCVPSRSVSLSRHGTQVGARMKRDRRAAPLQ